MSTASATSDPAAPPTKPLTTKQRAFVEAYLANGFNATKAARDAGYKSPHPEGSRLLQNATVAAAVRARLTAAAMAADEVLARIAQIGRADFGDFLRVDEETVTLTWSVLPFAPDAAGQPDVAGATDALAKQGQVAPTDLVLYTATVQRPVARLDLQAAGDAGLLHLVKKYTLDTNGKVSVELHDALDALKTLAKHHGLLVDRTELRLPDGPPVKVYAGLDPELV
jgi:hypothetical protein